MKYFERILAAGALAVALMPVTAVLADSLRNVSPGESVPPFRLNTIDGSVVDSGAMRGRRTTWGGRATVRSAMYMATLVAVRYNPRLRPVYEQLLARGKRKNVALTACMRKLLTILNAMLR